MGPYNPTVDCILGSPLLSNSVSLAPWIYCQYLSFMCRFNLKFSLCWPNTSVVTAKKPPIFSLHSHVSYLDLHNLINLVLIIYRSVIFFLLKAFKSRIALKNDDHNQQKYDASIEIYINPAAMKVGSLWCARHYFLASIYLAYL